MKKSKSTRTKRGRRSLLNPALTEKLCRLLECANSVTTTCGAVGISTSTFHSWIVRGENGEAEFQEFSASCARARSTAKIKLVKVLVDAAKLDWRAASWLLERQWPNEYGRAWREPLVGEADKPEIGVKIVMSQTDGTEKELSFEEAAKTVGADKWPVIDQRDEAHPNGNGSEDVEADNDAEPESYFELEGKGLL
jgi:hypothetical protein